MFAYLYNSIKYKVWYAINKYRYSAIGINSYIKNPIKISGYKNIELGDNVSIGTHAWLSAVPISQSAKCLLKIGDGTVVGNFNHIYATSSIIFGKKVLTADKVYISDNLHSYTNINIPIMDQPLKQLNEVYIGDGSWIGENVCILGANIGRNCVIGANSVVTKNLPDYSVAVGAPAKIIKRFDVRRNLWIKTSSDGNFLE